MKLICKMIRLSILLYAMLFYTTVMPFVECLLLILENVIFSNRMCYLSHQCNIQTIMLFSKEPDEIKRRQEAEQVINNLGYTPIEEKYASARKRRIKCRLWRKRIIHVWKEEVKFIRTFAHEIWCDLCRSAAEAEKRKIVLSLSLDKRHPLWQEYLSFLEKDYFNFYSIKNIWADEHNIVWIAITVLNPRKQDQESENLTDLIKSQLLATMSESIVFMDVPDLYWDERTIYCSLIDSSLVIGIATSEFGKEKLVESKEKKIQKMAQVLSEDL